MLFFTKAKTLWWQNTFFVQNTLLDGTVTALWIKTFFFSFWNIRVIRGKCFQKMLFKWKCCFFTQAKTLWWHFFFLVQNTLLDVTVRALWLKTFFLKVKFKKTRSQELVFAGFAFMKKCSNALISAGQNTRKASFFNFWTAITSLIRH